VCVCITDLFAQSAVPGTIQAEDFDQGAAGVAYHDTTPGNFGGQYRATDVDIETTTDTGGGYNVCWADATEWLKYTVNVSAAGVYDIDFRVASAGPGGTFHIEVNGVNTTGSLTVPDTGGWQTWTTIRKTGVSLSAGSQVWRLVMDTNGPTTAVGNFNYFRVAPSGGGTPYGGTPATLPGTIQAANFNDGGSGVAYFDTTPGNMGGQYRATDVDIEATTDTGGGYNVGWVDAGEWLNYTVNVTTAATYDLDVRVASLGAGGTFHLEVNGVDKTGPLLVPDTGGWQTWVTIRKTGVSLSAGPQLFRLVMNTNGPSTAVGNFNYFRLSPAAGTGSTPYGGTPAALPGTLHLEDFDEGGSAVAYFDTTPGNSGGQYRATDVDIEATSDTGGGYDLGWVFATEWLNYTVNVGATGTYNLDVRVASLGAGGTFHLEVNGVDKTGPLTVPDTGGWQTWTTIRETGVSLSAGNQVWRLVMDTNGPTTAVGNFNWIRLSSSSPAPTAVLTAPASGATYTAPASVTMTATTAPSGSIVRVEFFAGSTLVGTAMTAPYSATWSATTAGTYALRAVAYDAAGLSESSATVTVTVNGAAPPAPSSVVFAASPDHATLVTSYQLDVFAIGADPRTATSIASSNLGKPTPAANDDITVSLAAFFSALAPGDYLATVSAVGNGGSSMSMPPLVFTR
jgi:hypothetical protein